MAAMKAYTDLEQTKKLAKILPLETADMYYACGATTPNVMTGCKQDYRCYTMCWSLAALLDVLPTYIKHYNYDTRTYKNYHLNLYKAYYCNVSYTFGPSINENDDTLYCFGCDNFVDACVAMIEKLHEQKLL